MLPFEEIAKTSTTYLATIIESGAAVIIAYATVRAALQLLARAPAENVRMNLGRGLSLALEFEVAADILRTAVAPSWTQIGQLAAIIILRTALNYVLQREIGAERKQNLA